jgi:drug/metabolite transporter (DMT)-like permease
MKHWLMFGALGLIWGSSFLLIKIAVVPDGVSAAQSGLLDPLVLVSIRLSLAALSFLAVVALTRRKIPTDRKTLISFLVVGLFNNAVPFLLITWGERTIDSGLASVLNSTTPLFSLVIAHLALADDRISLGKIFGLISGFAGVILLATRSIDPTHPNPLLGQLAVLGAAASYAAATVYIRHSLRHIDGVVTASMQLSTAAAMVVVVTLFTVRPLPVLAAIQPSAVLAVLVLGLLNTFVAYLLYFSIIHAWGATRTTLVTYLMPPIGLVLGAIFESEAIDWKLIVGSGLIVGGVTLANLWRGQLGSAAAPVTAPVSAEGVEVTPS